MKGPFVGGGLPPYEFLGEIGGYESMMSELARDDIKIKQILHMKNDTYKKKMKGLRR